MQVKKQNLFHSCLAQLDRLLGKGGREVKFIAYDFYTQIIQTVLLAKMQRGDETVVKLFVVSPPFAGDKSYWK